jgi:hypothetical protein
MLPAQDQVISEAAYGFAFSIAARPCFDVEFLIQHLLNP